MNNEEKQWVDILREKISQLELRISRLENSPMIVHNHYHGNQNYDKVNDY